MTIPIDKKVIEAYMESLKVLKESDGDQCVCSKCGFTGFKVYVTTIIDDARLYCMRCASEWEGYTKRFAKKGGERK